MSRSVLLVVVAALTVTAAACAGGGPASASVTAARTYVQAVLNRDGETLWPLLDTATRHSVDGVVAAAHKDPAFRGPADCPHVIKLLIGYPHENMAYRFTKGKLLSVGGSRAVTVGGHRYVGVEVRVGLKTEANGSYAPLGKRAPSPTLTDTVWLVRLVHGWRTAKASLTLMAALNGDILSGSRLERTYAQQALQPPTR